MVLQQRIYDIDDLWDLLAENDDDSKDYELIDGVLVETSASRAGDTVRLP